MGINMNKILLLSVGLKVSSFGTIVTGGKLDEELQKVQLNLTEKYLATQTTCYENRKNKFDQCTDSKKRDSYFKQISRITQRVEASRKLFAKRGYSESAALMNEWLKKYGYKGT